MILVDYRTGSKELLPYIQKWGIKAELHDLCYADCCFEGNGPHGPITIGIERKTLHDMLMCIEDARYAAHQRPGMLMMYSKSFLCLEGLYSYGDGNGFDHQLMQGYRKGQSWGPLKLKGGRTPLYAKLYRYLLSVSMSGVIITQTHDLPHTAYNICEMYQWFQKKWGQHTSLIEVQKLAVPSLTAKPSLVRRWASELTDIGVVHSLDAERHFKTAHALANGDEGDWISLPGIGAKTASKVVKEINGWK